MGRHKEWRKIAKKMRRKRIRSAAAAERDEDEKQRLEKISSTPYYKAWLAEQEALEAFQEQEERNASILAHEKWVFMEAQAQESWARKQKALMEEEAKRKEQEALIQREWEKEQEKERLEKEAKEAEEKRKKEQYDRLMEQMDSFIEGSGAKPEGLYTSYETNPGREPCPFFSKVGACRFRDSCTRNHQRPGISSVLLIPGFYSHFSLEIGIQGEYDTDINLEFDQSERFRHFREFFDDVTPELEKFGPIVQLRVCSNTDPHLRGNVYVAYKSERAAAAAYKALNGRFYAGRVLSVEFVNIPSWKNAICGLQYRGTCPKGSKCNFLHVFRNPNNLYSSWDKPEKRENYRSPPERDDWRWTPSPPFVSGNEDGESNKRQKKKESEEEDRHRCRRSCRESKKGSDRRKDRRSRSSDRQSSSRSRRDQSRDRLRTPRSRRGWDRLNTPSDRRDRSRDRLSNPSDRRDRSRDRLSTPCDQNDKSNDRLNAPSHGRDKSRDSLSAPRERRDRSKDRPRSAKSRQKPSRDRRSSTPNRKNRSNESQDTPSDHQEQSKDSQSTQIIQKDSSSTPRSSQERENHRKEELRKRRTKKEDEEDDD